MESQVRGGTRWKRFALVMVPSVAATAALGVALAQGALAASFSVSGQSFKVRADQLVGTDFVQYGGVAEGHDLDGKDAVHPVAVSGFKKADDHQYVPVGGHPERPAASAQRHLELACRIEQPEGNPVQATNLYLDVESLQADNAEFKDMDIGVAAGEDKRPGMAPRCPESKFGSIRSASPSRRSRRP